MACMSLRGISEKPGQVERYNWDTQHGYGYGLGVRSNSPLGPIKLDYGIGENQNKFHFSFGTQF